MDTSYRHSWDPALQLSGGHLGGLSEGLEPLDLLLEGAEHLGAEPGEGHVEVGVGGQADQQRQPGGGQHAEQQAGQGEVTHYYTRKYGVGYGYRRHTWRGCTPASRTGECKGAPAAQICLTGRMTQPM